VRFIVRHARQESDPLRSWQTVTLSRLPTCGRRNTPSSPHGVVYLAEGSGSRKMSTRRPMNGWGSQRRRGGGGKPWEEVGGGEKTMNKMNKEE
jgi:hypothetical protein